MEPFKATTLDHGISRSLAISLIKSGTGPAVMRAGHRPHVHVVDVGPETTAFTGKVSIKVFCLFRIRPVEATKK